MLRNKPQQTDTSKAKLIIDRNLKAEEGSFFYFFHERYIFDGKLCNELITAIRDVSLSYDRNEPLPREICKNINFLNTTFNQKVFYYLNDKFKKEFSRNTALEHLKYLERFCDAVEGFFVGYASPESRFEPFDGEAKL